MDRGIADMVEQLADLTESSVSAATSLDAPRVGLLARERADLMFELQIQLQARPTLEEHERARARAATERLAQAEHRLDRTVNTLLRFLSPPSPSATVYGRSGSILEVSRGHAG